MMEKEELTVGTEKIQLPISISLHERESMRATLRYAWKKDVQIDEVGHNPKRF